MASPFLTKKIQEKKEMATDKKKHYALAIGATLFVDPDTGKTLTGKQTLTLPDDSSETVSRAIQGSGLVEVDAPYQDESKKDEKN